MLTQGNVILSLGVFLESLWCLRFRSFPLKNMAHQRQRKDSSMQRAHLLWADKYTVDDTIPSL